MTGVRHTTLGRFWPKRADVAPVALALAALGVLAGCSDSPPTSPGPDQLRAQLVVSEPVAVAPPASAAIARVAVARQAAPGADAGVAYVSLPPGSFPEATTAIVRNRAAGASLAVPIVVPMADGGFDPVAVSASVGDELVIEVRGPAGVVASLSVKVPARRPPKVVRVDPPKGKTDVPLNSRITVVFSEPVDPASVTVATVQLSATGQPVAGTVQVDPGGLTAEFVPAALRSANTEYTLVVQGVRDRTGDALEAPVTSQFTTGTVLAASIRVTVVTTGEDLDADGYLVTVDASPAPPMGVNASITVGGLREGTHTVLLRGVSENCTVGGSNPQGVTVTSGAETAVSFAVTCVRAVVTFTPTGGMTTPRAFHTATLLRDGRVLIAGGWGGEALSSAELYDPATGTFTPTGSMTTARQGHSATLLPDGRVLIAGDDRSAELYDPASGTFSRTGSMLEAQFRPEATLLANGKVLFTGGVSESTAICAWALARPELYDPATGTFTMTGAYLDTTLGCNEYVGEVRATRLLTGRVLVAIGNGSAAELYDPASGTFSWTGALSTTGQATAMNGTATLLTDGRVLLAGGRTEGLLGLLAGAELYSESTGAFVATGSMASARASHTATLLSDGRVLVAGGDGGLGCGCIVTGLSSAELYDPSTGTFAPAGFMSVPRVRHQATLLNDGRVLITGGRRNSLGDLTVYASAELYVPGAASAGSVAARRAVGSAERADAQPSRR